MTRLIALVQLALEEPSLCVLRAAGGFAVPPFSPKPVASGRPWGTLAHEPHRLRTSDADLTLTRMGFAVEQPWEEGSNGQWSAGVDWAVSLPELAASASEPVSVTLNTARLFAGRFTSPAPASELVGAGRVDAVARLVRDLSTYAEAWEVQARAALRRLNPVRRVALNVMVMPWDPPAVSLANTAPDDGPLPWHVWSTATRLTPHPPIPDALR